MDSISGIKDYGSAGSLYKIDSKQSTANETSQKDPTEAQIDTIDLSDESKNMLRIPRITDHKFHG